MEEQIRELEEKLDSMKGELDEALDRISDLERERANLRGAIEKAIGDIQYYM